MQTKKDWIKSQLLPEETANEAASRLNTPITIANPTPQLQVPAPIDLVAIRALVPDKEAYKVLNSLIWSLITDAIKKSDLVAVESHIKALHGGELISDETLSKLAPFLSATIPDPIWQKEVAMTPAQSAGFESVFAFEVQSVLENNAPV